MRVLRLALVNYKRMIKNFGNIAFMLLTPLIIIAGIHFTANSGKSSDINTAYSVFDKGTYAEEMLKDLNISKYVFYNDHEKAMELLENNDVAAVYRIPEDFTEKIKRGKKPVITSFKREEGNAALSSEINLNDEVNKRIKEQILLNRKLIEDKSDLSKLSVNTEIEPYKRRMSSGLESTVMLIIYFIILSSNTIGGEILSLKKQRILSRAVTTANRGYEIIGSIYLAMFFLQVSVYLLVLILGKFIIGYPLVDFHIAFINIVLTSLVSISLGVFITRIIQNPGVASLVSTLICVVTFFVSIMALNSDSIREIPWILHNLAKFTPQYWAFDSLEYSRLFPNAFVLLLMAGALFTAGNFKVRNFVNKS